MKKSKRTISASLAALLLVSAASCSGSGSGSGGGGRDTENTTTAATTTPATTNLNDLDHEVDWDEMANIDSVDASNEIGTGPLYTPGQKAGAVNALCYYDLVTEQPELAELLAQRYGGTLETNIVASGSAYFEQLGMLVAAGDSPDIVRYDWMAFPGGVARNMYTPLDDWLDMDSPLWADEKSIIEQFAYQGKHYYYPSDIQTNFAIIYNKTALEEAAMPDPMELYFNDEWTWDTFEDMLIKWSQMGEDYVGFTGGSWSSMMFVNTTGVKTIDLNGSEITNNLKSSEVRRAMDWLSGLKHDDLIGDGFVEPGTALVDGKLLFLGMGLTWGYESAQEGMFKNSIDAEIGAVPFPRDPQADRYYLSSDSFGFMVPAGAKNIQGAVSWILCGRIYETDPETVAAEYAEMTDPGPTYYAKCPECKYDYVSNNNDDLTVCPECSTARRQKFKRYYSEEQMKILDDMTNPEKFGMVFDNVVGFSDEFNSLFTGGEESIFDGPIYYGSSYTQVIEASNSLVEAYLEPYRTALAGNGTVE